VETPLESTTSSTDMGCLIENPAPVDFTNSSASGRERNAATSCALIPGGAKPQGVGWLANTDQR
jgi:hypothetical protein